MATATRNFLRPGTGGAGAACARQPHFPAPSGARCAPWALPRGMLVGSVLQSLPQPSSENSALLFPLQTLPRPPSSADERRGKKFALFRTRFPALRQRVWVCGCAALGTGHVVTRRQRVYSAFGITL